MRTHRDLMKLPRSRHGSPQLYRENPCCHATTAPNLWLHLGSRYFFFHNSEVFSIPVSTSLPSGPTLHAILDSSLRHTCESSWHVRDPTRHQSSCLAQRVGASDRFCGNSWIQLPSGSLKCPLFNRRDKLFEYLSVTQVKSNQELEMIRRMQISTCEQGTGSL